MPSFHPIYATTFLLGFFQHIIIEGWSFDSAIGLLLNTSTLSCHAGIMCFWIHDSVVKECLLKWSHSHTQPRGQPVLYQCPTCKCIQSWDQKGLGASSELGREVTMQCSYKGEKEQCPECLTFVRPTSPPFKPIKLTEGIWMAIGLKDLNCCNLLLCTCYYLCLQRWDLLYLHCTCHSCLVCSHRDTTV